jgi:hypothetical protein
LVAGEQRHRQSEEKGNKRDERNRIDTGAFGMSKELTRETGHVLREDVSSVS